MPAIAARSPTPLAKSCAPVRFGHLNRAQTRDRLARSTPPPPARPANIAATQSRADNCGHICNLDRARASWRPSSGYTANEQGPLHTYRLEHMPTPHRSMYMQCSTTETTTYTHLLQTLHV